MFYDTMRNKYHINTYVFTRKGNSLYKGYEIMMFHSGRFYLIEYDTVMWVRYGGGGGRVYYNHTPKLPKTTIRIIETVGISEDMI